MLIQIPFFIAFYWVLLESVEIRQAPFFLWIDDLSSRDPYFILPIMMGPWHVVSAKTKPGTTRPNASKGHGYSSIYVYRDVCMVSQLAWFFIG